ncbi:alpha/beta fold hydrolase [Marinobacter sp. 1-3A]|uniref:alpha/beta fold hydrolase n=1 Tax=Marinobacter sp. 1-3A TaxID=2582920 RepID=UPI00190715ED|nr:alpha/beta fold hydrolase [Marinobacter sp. 1-3A]MBK1873125.1 alpha/beta fold hydrolase [Marinobacter sp. 1-3A]
MMYNTHRITSNNISLHAVTEGNPDGIPLVLVHGYPDNHRVWDKVVSALASDFFLVRYDVRGAGLSDKPVRTRDYRLSLLAQDLEAVVDELLPNRRFHLLAHDWGSIQSWESVGSGPLQKRILSFTSISGPCLDHVGAWLRAQSSNLSGGGPVRMTRQLLKSWYVFLFQIPVVPEAIWSLGLDRKWPVILQKREGVADACFSSAQKDDGRYGVRLYRANFLSRLLMPQPRFASCPVQLIILKQDNYVGADLFGQLNQWVGKLTRVQLNAPHWAQLTEPDAIASAVRSFIRS